LRGYKKARNVLKPLPNGISRKGEREERCWRWYTQNDLNLMRGVPVSKVNKPSSGGKKEAFLDSRKLNVKEKKNRAKEKGGAGGFQER